MEQTTKPSFLPKNDEFIKVFLALLILDGVLNLVQAMLSWRGGGFAPTTTFSIITGILALVVFILAIIVWVRCVKRKYPKFLLWTAISRVFVPIILGGLVGVISMVFVFTTFRNTPIETNPATPEAVPEEIAEKLKWLTIAPMGNGLVFIVLGALTWMKIRKS